MVSRPVGHIRFNFARINVLLLLTGHVYLKTENIKKREIRFCALGLLFFYF